MLIDSKKKKPTLLFNFNKCRPFFFKPVFSKRLKPEKASWLKLAVETGNVVSKRFDSSQILRLGYKKEKMHNYRLKACIILWQLWKIS